MSDSFQIKACEQQMFATRSEMLKIVGAAASSSSSSSSASSSTDKGFFFKFANRVMDSVQIDVRDIHIAFSDPARGLNFGVLLCKASSSPILSSYQPSVSLSGQNKEICIAV